MISHLMATLRRSRTFLTVWRKRSFLTTGPNLHVGRGSRLWAPQSIGIGRDVYIGKDVHVEANCDIGDFCLIANRVAIIGRHDHDFSRVGWPVRYAPWIGSKKLPSKYIGERAVIEQDVWLGYGATVLTGVTVGRGAIVAACSVVTKDVPAYSVVAGVPASVIGTRFEHAEKIGLHEESLLRGRFSLSERGYDHCTVVPYEGERAQCAES